jgi:hypothetical protein
MGEALGRATTQGDADLDRRWRGDRHADRSADIRRAGTGGEQAGEQGGGEGAMHRRVGLGVSATNRGGRGEGEA